MLGMRQRLFTVEKLKLTQSIVMERKNKISELSNKIKEAEEITKQKLIESTQAELKQLEQDEAELRAEIDAKPNRDKLENKILGLEKDLKKLLNNIQNETKHMKHGSAKDNLLEYLPQSPSQLPAFQNQLAFQIRQATCCLYCCYAGSFVCMVVMVLEMCSMCFGGPISSGGGSMSSRAADGIACEIELDQLKKIQGIVTQCNITIGELEAANREHDKIQLSVADAKVSEPEIRSSSTLSR